MPIVLARIDNRLLHGQILTAWVSSIRAQALLVLDDEAARNTLERSAMEIAIPPEIQFAVAPVAQAAEAVRCLPAGKRTVVLLRDVADAVRAIDGGLRIDRLNLGNVHFSAGRQAISHTVYLSADELVQLERLAASGVAVEVRTLPGDAPLALSDVRRLMGPSVLPLSPSKGQDERRVPDRPEGS